jgi:hypothetical protein
MQMIRYAELYPSLRPSQRQGSRAVPWCAANTSKLHEDAQVVLSLLRVSKKLLSF